MAPAHFQVPSSIIRNGTRSMLSFRRWSAAGALLCLAMQAEAQYTAWEIMKADDPFPQSGGNVGDSVSIEHDTAFVGAAGRNSTRGTVYVFERNEDSWVLKGEVSRGGLRLGDSFGHSVDVRAGILVVGAVFADAFCPEAGCDLGSASIFEQDNGVWIETLRLQPPDLMPSDFFGHAVAASETTVLVSATGQNRGAGSVYVFERNGTSWNAAGKLEIIDDSTEARAIGYDIGLDGNTAVVGASGTSVYGFASGAAYVFEKGGDVWTQVARLIPDDGAAEDVFGGSVAISSDTIIIGASSDDDLGSGSGAVYVFERTDGGWLQVAKLHAPDGHASAVFGWDVALKGDSALIGSATKNTFAHRSGSAYVFKRIDGIWTFVSQIYPGDPSVDQVFGAAVALSQSTILVGSQGDSTLGLGAGSAYFFLRGEALAGNVDTGAGSFPIDVVALDGSVGDACRNVTVRANTSVPLFVNAAPQGNGHYALWILDGGLAGGGKTFLRKRNGRLFDVGTGARCLPLANTRVAGACPCPLAFPRGLTSARLPQAIAERVCLPSGSALPRAPVFHSLVFPPGNFLVSGVVHDRNSPNSPALNVSMTNWIVVNSVP